MHTVQTGVLMGESSLDFRHVLREEEPFLPLFGELLQLEVEVVSRELVAQRGGCLGL